MRTCIYFVFFLIFVAKDRLMLHKKDNFAHVVMEKTWGIVLGSVRLPGSKAVVRIFTEARGTVPFIVHSARGKSASVGNIACLPLQVLEIDYEHRDRRELQTLHEVRLMGQYTTLPYHPLKQTMALFLAEFLTHALKYEGSNPPLLQYIVDALQRIDRTETHFTAMHTDMLRGIAALLGYGSPQLQDMTLQQLLDYYRENVPEFPVLNSTGVLHEVLS